jgi:YqcI/YcgG family
VQEEQGTMGHPRRSSHTGEPGLAGALVPRLRGDGPASPLAQLVHAQVRALVLNPAFPCLGARAALNQGTYRFGMYAALASAEATRALGDDLLAFVAEQPSLGSALRRSSRASTAHSRSTSGTSSASSGSRPPASPSSTTSPGIPGSRRTRTTRGSPSASAGGPSSWSDCTRGARAGRAASPGRRSSSTPTTSSSTCAPPGASSGSSRPSGDGTPPCRGARTLR